MYHQGMLVLCIKHIIYLQTIHVTFISFDFKCYLAQHNQAPADTLEGVRLKYLTPNGTLV